MPINVEVKVDVTYWPQHRIEALRDFVERSEAGPELIGDDKELLEADTSNSIWKEMALVEDLLERVIARGGLAQARIIRFAMRNGGRIERADVFEQAGWDPTTRSLRGITRVVDKGVEEMIHDGLLPSDREIPQVLVPHYEGPGKAKWFTVPRAFVALQQQAEDADAA